MTWSFICIICPNGCEITAEYEEGTVYAVRGAACPKGDTHVYRELTDPRRNIVTSVLAEDGELPLANVRFSHPIPRGEIFRTMEVINTTRLQTPTAIGQVILHSVCGRDTNMIITENVARANARIPLL